MRRVDSLSRKVDWAEGVEKYNENQIMFKKKWLEIRAIKKKQLFIEEAEEGIIEK